MSRHIDVLAEELVAAGVAHAFGVAGSGASYALIQELAARGVTYHPVGHEAAAAMMAGAACRSGKTKATAITIKGPGFANLVPGIVSNRYENRPAVTVSEAYAPEAPASAQHKRLDHSGILAAVAKASAFAGDGAAVRRVFAVAVEESPGPVHIELAATGVDESACVYESAAASSGTDPFERLLDRVAKARRPALVLGSAVTRLVAGVDWSTLGVPVATTAAAKGAIDETGPFAAGVATGETGVLAPETAVLSQADLVVGVGLRPSEMVRCAPFVTPLALVDTAVYEGTAGFAAEVMAIVDDLASAVDSLAFALASGPGWGSDVVAGRRAAIAKRLSGAWLPSDVFAATSRHAPEAVLALDTGLFAIVGETAWPARRPDLFCGSSVGRFMGTGIPTALGIAVAERRAVVAAVGDGGAKPYLPELRIAATEGLPLLVAVMSDGRFGTIAQADPVSRLCDPALATGAIEWRGVAESLGLEGRRAHSPEEAEVALSEWAARPRPMLLESVFDPGRYVAMTEGLR